MLRRERFSPNKTMPLKNIRNTTLRGEHRYSEHAVRQMIKRSIERHEVEDVIIKGEIIEEYPDDKYSPSCLIYAKTETGRNLHVHISLSPNVVIITTYEPDEDEWLDCRSRR